MFSPSAAFGEYHGEGRAVLTQVVSHEVRARLPGLLQQDLTFRESQRGLIHNLHAFAAKFPPQLPRHFITGLTEPGETVLDPMVGSGATVVEASLLGRNGLGVDLDPLAIRLTRAKTREYDPASVTEAGQRVLDRALLMKQMGDPLRRVLDQCDRPTHDFIDYWFAPGTQVELAALVLAIRDERDEALRELLEVLLSSIIVTKSGGVSLARDLAHSRPHRVSSKLPKSAFTVFRPQVERAARAIREIQATPKGKVVVIAADSRALPIRSESVDLIVTSPPYANAIDYMRAHKFSLVWLGENIGALSYLRGRYIGSEKCEDLNGAQLPSGVEETIEALKGRDARMAKVLRKYFYDMRLALGEMHRVLRGGRAAVVVVGPSTMRGLRIATHEHVASIGIELRFEVAGVVRRALDRDRRMMPARLDNQNHESVIEQRIHEEFVIGLVKR